MDSWILYSLAGLLLVCIPFMPKLLRLRVRFFRWIHWEWAARILEDHLASWSLTLRVVFLFLAALLLYIGWAH